MKLLRCLIVALLIAVPAFSSAPQARAAGPAMISILHAVPGAVVDVYVDGEELLADFEPGTLTDPVELPAGTYDLKVTAANAGADGEAVAEANGVEVPADASITVVAHLDGEGAPKLTAFVNDNSQIPAGQGRLTVRHTAAAPAVDVRANGEVAFSGLTNPNEESAELPAGTVSADVTLAGTDTVAIGPADVEIAEGTHTIVYAWGSAEDDNLMLAVQTISGMGGSPNGAPAGGDGSAVATESTRWALMLGVAGLVAAGVVVLRRRTTQAVDTRP